jgi:hypothetical protein
MKGGEKYALMCAGSGARIYSQTAGSLSEDISNDTMKRS